MMGPLPATAIPRAGATRIEAEKDWARWAREAGALHEDAEVLASGSTAQAVLPSGGGGGMQYGDMQGLVVVGDRYAAGCAFRSLTRLDCRLQADLGGRVQVVVP